VRIAIRIGSPREVIGPRIRVHEQLDDREHAEERQRGQPRGKTEDQERRAAELERRAQGGRQLEEQRCRSPSLSARGNAYRLRSWIA
jgi:hypothetical protein